jgi:serine/threonine protein kinase
MATDPAPGAASYRAPELAHARPEHVDGRADLFAVGAILYTLVTGRSPRRGRSAEHRLDAHEAAPSVVIVAPGLPAAATSVVDRAMQWRPSARYPDAGAMRFAVLAVCRTLVRTSCLAADPPFEQVFAIDERPTLPETPRAQRAP